MHVSLSFQIVNATRGKEWSNTLLRILCTFGKIFLAHFLMFCLLEKYYFYKDNATV